MDGSLALGIISIIGIVITGVFTLAGVYWGGRRESVQWLRAERMRVYADYLAESDRAVAASAREVINYVTSPDQSAPLPQAMAEHIPSMARLAIVGPPEVYNIARDFSGTWNRGVTGVIESRVAGADGRATLREVTAAAGKHRTAFIAATSRLLGSTK